MSSTTEAPCDDKSKRRKREDGTAEDIGTAVESLQSLLTAKRKELDEREAAFEQRVRLFEQTKSKELEEREAAFEKRVRLFEQANPQAGKESDILKLNIGGTSKIAVTRRVLTHFEDSMLAAKFSGRWDDSLDKDDEGNIFIDLDATEFNKLISYLRLCVYNSSDDNHLPPPPPPPTYAFCSMLAYYGLLIAIYSPCWDCYWGQLIAKCITPSHPQVFKSGESGDYDNTGIIFQSDESYPGLFVSSFRVLVHRGYTAQVGWSTYEAFVGESERVGYNRFPGNFAIDLSSKRFVSRGIKIREQDGSSLQGVNILEKDITIECSHDGHGNYTIRVEGVDGDISEYQHRELQTIMYPAISFTGLVTISNLRYRYPRSPPR